MFVLQKKEISKQPHDRGVNNAQAMNLLGWPPVNPLDYSFTLCMMEAGGFTVRSTTNLAFLCSCEITLIGKLQAVFLGEASKSINPPQREVVPHKTKRNKKKTTHTHRVKPAQDLKAHNTAFSGFISHPTDIPVKSNASPKVLSASLQSQLQLLLTCSTSTPFLPALFPCFLSKAASYTEVLRKLGWWLQLPLTCCTLIVVARR